MYVTSSRGSESIAFKGQYYRSGVLKEYNFSFPRRVEGVYSWRTGSGSNSKSVENNNSGAFGITKPTKGNNILETLDSRRRYFENLDRTVGEIHSSSTTKYTSRTDHGHEFTKFLSWKGPLWASGTAVNMATGKESSRIPSHGWYNFSNYTTMPNFSSRTFPFPTSKAEKLVTGTNLRGIQNGVYDSANPDRGGTTLIITVLELLRGDIPSVVRNVHKNITRAREDRKRYLGEVGDEYLNIMFGWAPLLDEIGNVIRLLLKLDSLVYGGDAYRRHRRVQGPVITSERRVSGALAPVNTPFNAGTVFLTGTAGESTAGGLAFCDFHMETTLTEDYAFSAKFSGIARPMRQHDEFLRRAEYVLNQLGGDSPARVLWELTSWSWLIDWFAQIGNSITSATTYSPKSGKYAQDFAYWTTITRYLVHGRAINVQPVGKNTVSSVNPGSYLIEVKDRERITPFGFGTRFGSLSSYQWSILIALGLAKAT